MTTLDLSTYGTLAATGYQISNRFTALNRNIDVDQPDSPYKPAIVNESQRFEIWAVNLGLYHGGHSSLDYRFRDAPQVSEYVRQLFGDLDRALIQCTYVDQVRNALLDNLKSFPQSYSDQLSQDTEVTTSVSTEDDFQQVDDELQAEDDSEEEDFNSYQAQPLAQVYLDGAIATIDRLYRVSFKIRNPAMRIGLSKARSYREVDESTGVDLIDQYTKVDLRHLQELFSSFHQASLKDHQSHYLVQRLAKANTRRRQQFRYWRKRKAKFQRIHEPNLVNETDNAAAQGILQKGAPLDMTDTPQVAPSQPSTATKLEVTKLKLEDDRSVISTSTYAIMANDNDGDGPSIPQPPKKYSGAKEFECPYCFTMCPGKMLAKKAWNQHVLRDLRPYVCIYDDCKAADQQYDSLSDWMGHEVIHQTCGSSSTHSHTEDRQLPMNIMLECPFCLIQDATLSHIGFHLRQVACFALPRSTGEEDGSDKTGAGSDQAEIESDDGEVSDMGSSPSYEEDGDGSNLPPPSSLPSSDRETAMLTNDALQTMNESIIVQNPESNVDDFLQQLDDSTCEGNPILEHDPDTIFLKNRGVSYPVLFPSYSIGDGSLSIGDLRREAAKELDTADPQRIRLFYKGRLLREDNESTKAENLKQYSEVMCVISEVPSSRSTSPSPSGIPPSISPSSSGAPRGRSRRDAVKVEDSDTPSPKTDEDDIVEMFQDHSPSPPHDRDRDNSKSSSDSHRGPSS